MIIAIDGPSAAGKGTLARRLAAHFGYVHLDTGALYRAAGWKVVREGGDPDDPATAEAAARALDPADTRDPALRTDQAAAAASKVAKIPAVRQALLEFQRAFAARPPGGAGGAVLDGRDIGTVVCPDADVKLFVTASDDERARRRCEELRAKGAEVIYARVLQDLRDRDARDREREVAPLKPAEDAVELDTTELDEDAAFEAALAIIHSRRRGRGSTPPVSRFRTT